MTSGTTPASSWFEAPIGGTRRIAAGVDVPATEAKLVGLPPVIAPDARVVVLGSFPGVASLVAGQYYGHPRNQFWAILSSIWQVDLVTMPYAERIEAVKARRLGIWDVHATCRRVGSLDSAIEAAEPNDLTALLRMAPALVAVGHNGAESARSKRHTAALGLAVMQLPSTSPAHASWSFDRKLAAWRAFFNKHGLT